MKKILYIHHGKGLGGAPLSLLYLIKGLNKQKYKPIVLFLYDSEVIKLFKENEIEIIGPIFEHDFAHTKIWWYKWYQPHILLRSIYSQIKTILLVAPYWYEKIKPDIVHLNTSSLIGWAIASKNKNIPIVWHIREPLANGYIGLRKKLVESTVKKYATKIIPICKNDATPWIGCEKTKVIYNPVDKNIFYPRDTNSKEVQEFLSEKNIPERTKKILFLGGLSAEKGTHVILESFIKLKNQLSNSHLLICGYFNLDLKNIITFSPSEKYKKYILRLYKKVSNSITILGPINNVPIAMAACDVIVFPATIGHFARPIIEAGFMAKPIIASNLEGIEELVINNESGFLINKDNYNDWANTLLKILIDKDIATKMGKKAFDFCIKNFDSSLHVKKVEDCYKEIFNY